MKLKERIKNSIRAYIIGDTLGVPYEFRSKGSFECIRFSKGGVHGQSKGTWSDDSSILLCLIDAFRFKKSEDRYFIFKQNLKKWYSNQGFDAGSGLFDIGCQTLKSILNDGYEPSDRMSNGALFYSLPIACLTLDKSSVETKRLFANYCSYTHNNNSCFYYGYKLCCVLKKLLRSLPFEKELIAEFYENKGDVINTYNLCIDQFLQAKNRSTTLFEDLCRVVNLGQDTDTNAAIFGALIGCIKPVNEKDWEIIRRCEWIDKLINDFVDCLDLKEDV